MTHRSCLAPLCGIALLGWAGGCDTPVEQLLGELRITVTSSGADVDPDGYALVVEDHIEPVASSGGQVVLRLPVGLHFVLLSGLADNCGLNQPNPQDVNIVGADVRYVAFSVACAARTASVAVTLVTTGLDFDANGYTLRIDGGAPRTVAPNETSVFDGLAAGSHTVLLEGVAGNCTAAGDNPRTVSVNTGGPARDTARVTFQVSCVAVTGAIEVAAVTFGVDHDPDGYQVQLDGRPSAPVAANGRVVIDVVSPGDHSVALVGTAANCSVGGTSPRTLSVKAGGLTRDTARTAFDVSCVSLTGTIQVTVATSGRDLDPDGYTVYGDAYCYDYYGQPYCYSAWERSVGVNGSVTIGDVPAGEHTVLLAGLAGNCAVLGDNPRMVTVSFGGATTRVTLQVTCGALLVPYGATGYRFRVLPDSLTLGGGFESPTFDDVAAGFSDGGAAFGSANPAAPSCPLDAAVKTNWPVNTDLLLRKTFTLPAGTSEVMVRVAIDNDVQVFVNGVDITASAGTATLAGGFQRHGGCATPDSFVFRAPNEILRVGANLLALRARDQGVISYVDVSVTGATP